MDTDQWQRVEQLCQAALELDPTQQPEFLEGACGGDEALRREVESLLAHQRHAGQFLESPALLVTAKDLARDEEYRSGEVSRLIGCVLSDYRIVEKLADGGMGEIYTGVRADGTYDKQVAIKLVQTGLSTDYFLARFKHERQILASLDHPNIARLIDGGSTEEGLPYIVMEYIEGQPIDEYCEHHALDIPERLELFRMVCSAVQYAHKNLVVHRDLKPGNILVTQDGVPKLLDFGIAKILHPQQELQEIRTMTVMTLMTPDYASPEQIGNEAITTSSDVYSLGVILYVLLTGRHPHKSKGTAPHELVRAICEVEPEKPSTAAARPRQLDSKSATASAAPERARRDDETKKRRRALAGDLDNIILKALRKEPERRYASVEQFSEDIRRHLMGLPVVAHPDSLAYRARKFVGRHRMGVGAVALLILSLSAGLVATLREARIARFERIRAERRFNDVRGLANSLMFEVHDSIQDLAGATPARQLLVSKALQYLDSLSQEAAGDISLQRELAAAYEKVGNVQGQLGFANLGDSAGALQSYQKALAIREALRAARPKDRQDQGNLAMIYERLGRIQLKTGSFTSALEWWRKSVTILEDLAAADPRDAQARRNLAICYDGIGDAFVELNNFDEALKSYQQAVTIFEGLRAADPGNAMARRNLSVTYKRVGGIFEYTGRISEALDEYREALAIDEFSLSVDPTNALARRDLSISYTNIGDILSRTGRLREALERYRQALAIDEALAAADPKDAHARFYLERSYEKIGNVMLKAGHAPGAIHYFRKALETAQALSGADPLNALARSDLAAYSSRLGESYTKIAASAAPDESVARWQQARSWYQKSLDIWTDLHKRGGLPAREDGENPDKAAHGVARCDAALAKLRAPTR